MPDSGYFVGAISGTSIDAIDCALIECRGDEVRLVATQSGAIPQDLRERISALCTGTNISLELLGSTDVDIGRAFADTVNTLLANTSLKAADVVAIGSHGQTVYHLPTGPAPFSLQIGDPNTIAELTGITTVADFRRRDMAAGGQGAPLAPLFHQHFFFHPTVRRCVLNVGGISNISWINNVPGTAAVGYDTGPGNVLMDEWTRQHLNQAYDPGGQWASQGHIHEALLQAMLTESYFRQPSPKSTGRELFNKAWLQKHLETVENCQAVDVQRTLLELTAVTVSNAIKSDMAARGHGLDELMVCGGGAHNDALMERLQALLPESRVASSDAFGLAPDWVEAVTFAWLAQKTINRQKLSTELLTGATHPVILGGVYYA